MSRLTTLGKVFDRVDEISRNCHDKLISVDEISFNNIESVNIGSETHKMRPVAQRLTAYRLGIPYQYIIKCPEDLQQENLNHWITKERNDNLFFRFDGDEVRAMFTPKYKPVDNFEVMERLDSLGYSPDTEVQCNLDGEFMSLSIPDGNKTFSVNGDKFTPGISISNSEVGLACLNIAAFFLRLVCTNGLVSSTEIGASYRHISTKILNEFPEILNKVSYELSKQTDKFRISMDSAVDNMESTLSSFNRQFQISNEEKKAVDWAVPYEIGNPNTMFNVINTYTKAAQFEGMPAESSHKLSRIGGNVLDMLN